MGRYEAPKLLFVAGGIGSGKSTLLRVLAEQGYTKENSTIISFDDFTHASRVDLRRHFHDEKMGANEAWFLEERAAHFTKALAQHRTIIIETHLDHPHQLNAFATAARERGYSVELLGTIPSVETFFRIRYKKDRLTPHTPLGIMSQSNFIERWNELPFPVDRTRLYERLFDEKHDGVRLLSDSRRPDKANLKRMVELQDQWQTHPPSIETAFAEGDNPRLVDTPRYEGPLMPQGPKITTIG